MIIKIFGSKGEGKTTMAEYLTKILSEHGIQVTNSDTDSSDLGLEERMKILGGEKGPLKCEIKTIPLKMETRPQYAVEFTEDS